MKYGSTCLVGTALVLALCLGLTGCARGPSEAPATAPTPVNVSRPIVQDVTDYADFIGRTEAVDSVSVRARVWGYLEKVNFKEGALVKKGDVLFEIDPKVYEAVLNQAKAKVAQDAAQLKYNEADYQRTLKLAEKGAVSQDALELSRSSRDIAAANLGADKASQARAQLDLDYTKVIAPVSGRVSRYNVTVGNLVQSGDQGGGTLLTTIVSVDPMYVNFDVDEHSLLRVRKMILEGKAISARDKPLEAKIGLANEEKFLRTAIVNFVDNQVNPKTGTLRIRGVVSNKDEFLSPGLFVRIRVPIGFPHRALLISDRAIDTDQGQKIVYVLDRENKVVSRPVRLGALHDGLRVIEDGLTTSDRVIVAGLQQVRPGVTVEPKLVDMPRSGVKGQ
jgi:RND family efflux transporter MFP subunit